MHSLRWQGMSELIYCPRGRLCQPRSSSRTHPQHLRSVSRWAWLSAGGSQHQKVALSSRVQKLSMWCSGTRQRSRNTGLMHRKRTALSCCQMLQCNPTVLSGLTLSPRGASHQCWCHRTYRAMHYEICSNFDFNMTPSRPSMADTMAAAAAAREGGHYTLSMS